MYFFILTYKPFLVKSLRSASKLNKRCDSSSTMETFQSVYNDIYEVHCAVKI